MAHVGAEHGGMVGSQLLRMVPTSGCIVLVALTSSFLSCSIGAASALWTAGVVMLAHGVLAHVALKLPPVVTTSWASHDAAMGPPSHVHGRELHRRWGGGGGRGAQR